MTEHTPGPWRVGKHDGLYYVDTVKPRDGEAFLGKRIALCKDHEANARLIAGAPELLEALRDYVRSDACDCVADAQDCVWCVAQHAIAKAEGRASDE